MELTRNSLFWPESVKNDPKFVRMETLTLVSSFQLINSLMLEG